MKKIYQIGVIGAGVWGCHSLERELVATGRCRVKSIVNRREFGAGIFQNMKLDTQNYAEDVGAQVVDDAAVIFADPEIDIVSVMTSPAVKGEMILRALAAGKSFVTDKPLAFDRGTAQKIVEAEQKSVGVGCILAGYHTRPAVAELMARLQAGDMGEVKAIAIRLNFSGGIYPGFVPSPEWANDIFGGESVTIGSHAIITAMKIANAEIIECKSLLKNDFYRSYEDAGVDDYAIFLLKFANGAVANLSVGRLPYRIAGEDVIVEVTTTTHYARITGNQLTVYPGEFAFDGAFVPGEVVKQTFERFLDSLEDKSLQPYTSTLDAAQLLTAYLL